MKLLTFILLLSSHAFAINCPSLWSNGFPDRGRERTAFECTRHSSSSQYQLYYSNELSIDSITALLNAADEALQRSIRVFSALGTMPHVKAVLYHDPHFQDSDRGGVTYANAFLDWHRSSESCPVIIYPAALSFSTDYFKQLVAHELFHCFQKGVTPQQAANGTQRGVGLWWLEGVAQYFSNVVYPRVDLEYSDMFTRYSPVQSLTSQDYGNVHFFQSWANGSSNGNIIEFMRSMPTGSSPSQEQALANFPSIDNKLHAFAKEMVTASLRDSSGAEAPLAPISPQGNYEVPATDEEWTLEIPITAFTINYFKIRLPEKARISLRLANSDGLKVSIKHQDEMDWSELSTTVETPCDLAETYDLVITKSTPDTGISAVTIIFEQEEKADCPCIVDTRPRDECLYGTWDVDMGSVRAFYERLMGGMPNMRLVDFTGAMSATFNRNGTGTAINSNWQATMEMRTGRTTMTVINKIWGSTSWRYTTQGRGKICSEGVENSLQGTSTIIMGGTTRTVPIDNSVLNGASFGRQFTYECRGNHMLYKKAIGAGPGGSDMEFNYNYVKRPN